MSHFAKVQNGRVSEVIVAEQDFIDTLDGTWVQCSYNTHRNVHKLGGTPLRGNFPSFAYHYDSENDVFYRPRPFPSWVLNTTTWTWEAPIPPLQVNVDYNPETEIPVWDEETLSWVITPVND